MKIGGSTIDFETSKNIAGLFLERFNQIGETDESVAQVVAEHGKNAVKHGAGAFDPAREFLMAIVYQVSVKRAARMDEIEKAKASTANAQQKPTTQISTARGLGDGDLVTKLAKEWGGKTM